MNNFIKNNKVTVVAFIICVIFVILVFAIKLTFFPDEGRAIYGDRLDGIEEVEITSKQEKNIVSKLEEKGKILVIRPSKLVIIIRVEKDKEKIQEMYDLGTADALKSLTKINQFL